MSPRLAANLLDHFGQVVSHPSNGDAVECAASLLGGGFIVQRGEAVALTTQGQAVFGLVLAGYPGETAGLGVSCTVERCRADGIKASYVVEGNSTVEALACKPGMSHTSDDAARSLCSWCKPTRYSVVFSAPDCSMCPQV